ncbi:MAG: hypothetical protein OIN89_10035 [Candidatus Methanoperedens sp.]|jgi:predicted membrane protein|nr:hypothetical protein [Candidatus Methanoperedens sp.]PKL52979.1 MAG: hypothetical protein CVV36_09515 [Candidatus Methanoperedenaceae archaeon HGW-Methanoperedenaceae-1]
MTKSKKIFIGILGAVFLLSGMYYRNISYEYLGIGTWLAGIIYYTLYRSYREVVSFILGLLILHAGVLLLLLDKLSNPKLLGALVFTAGIIVVLGSGFSEYIKKSKEKTKYKQVPY